MAGTAVRSAAVYRPRWVDSYVEDLFAELPAILITGPRATGKTTTARRLVATEVNLDQPAQALAFRADPDAALRGLPEPILLDEWQEVPDVLGAVKRSVDLNPAPGRFLLTGSVRADLQTTTWPGTGRLVRVRMFGLTVKECQQPAAALGQPLLDRLAKGQLTDVPLPNPAPDLLGYIELALQSGFPEPALRLSRQSTRTAWLEGYLEQLFTRDAETLLDIRDPSRLRRYFEALAVDKTGLAAQNTLYEAANINRRTALAYEGLLSNMFILDFVPAWTDSNRLRRLVHTPKRYLVDPALAAAAVRLDATAVLREGDMLGRLLEMFVVAQLRPQIEIGSARPRLFHLREKDGAREIDLIAEYGHGVVGIEVKATAAPRADDAKHLVWLRDKLGDRFLAGVVFHTGPLPFALSDAIMALPICSLWG
jgi:uncharacterized protein